MRDGDLAYYCVYLLLHDNQFRVAHRNVDVRVIPKGPSRYLVDLALRRAVSVSPALLEISLPGDASALRRHGADAKLTREVYRDLNAFEPDIESLAVVRELCSRWLQQRAMQVGLAAAAGHLDRGELEQADVVLTKSRFRIERREQPTLLSKRGQALLSEERDLKRAIPTGLYPLDRAWRGGIRRSELGIIMGPTGTGKSMVLCQLAVEAFWKNKHVLYYSFELTEDQILERIICGILGCGREDIPKNIDLATQIAQRAKAEHRKLPTRAEIEVRSGDTTLEGLKHDLEAFKGEHGRYPGILLLDSADDVVPPGKFEKTYEGLRSLYTALRLQFAQEMNIPLWTTSQTNREAVEKSRVSLRHIGDAFAKAQKAHYVLGLAQGEAEREDMDGPLMNVYVLKDSLHGSRGAWMQCRAQFGLGENGYPRLDPEPGGSYGFATA